MDMVPLDLRPLLNPRSIAIVGASADEGGHGGRTLANLDRTGFAGRVFPVNPRYPTIRGRECFASVADIDEPIDMAYILLRADRALGAVKDCVDGGVPIIVVCTSGFAELGADGSEVQSRLGDLIRASTSRLLGPNCIGVMNIADNVISSPTFNITYDYTHGPVTIVSQSGGMGVNLVNRAQGRGIGIRAMISVGNEADIEAAELVEALADDDRTTVIALLIEQLRDGPRFVRAVASAHAAGKQVVALKIGRSDAGKRSTFGHTGAMAGEYPVFRAALRQLGVLEVQTVDQLIDVCGFLARGVTPAGNRVVVISPSGGECGYVADRASEVGLELPELSEATVQALTSVMRFGVPGNPLDLTGQVIGDGELLKTVMGVVMSDGGFDMTYIAIPTWGPYDSEHLLPRFVDAAAGSDRPVAISAWSAHGLTEKAQDVLRSSEVAHFSTADGAVDALAALVRAARSPEPWQPRAVPDVPMPPVLSLSGSEYSTKRFLEGIGLRTTREVLARDEDEALLAAADLGWPVVAKMLCTGVVHKSELGLVRLSIPGPDDLRFHLTQFRSIGETASLTREGFLVAEQVTGAEVIVGGVRDLTFGPIVMVGAGGLLAEFMTDRAFLMCPVTPSEAERAIDGLAVGRVLRGARGTSYDVSGLAELVSRFSELLAGAKWISEVDLNPVMVGPVDGGGGAVIVDASMAVLTPGPDSLRVRIGVP